jgi:hypothetical protein
LAGNASIGGTLAVTGVATLTAQPVLSSLTASSAVATDASKGLVSVTNTGTGNNVLATSPTLVTPALGTPSSATLTNATGLPVSTGISGLGSGVATFLATPSSANLAAAVTDETGTGALVFANSPTLVTPALGTPASGVVTNLTGTASININGTVGATTASTGAFTDVTTSGTVTHNAGTANGVAYLNGSKVLTTGSALTFDGTRLEVLQSGVGTGGSVIRVYNTSDGIGAGQLQIAKFGSAASYGPYAANTVGINAAGTSLLFGTETNNPVIFYQNNAEQMRLTSTGLGIGTSSPGYKVDAQGGPTVLRLKNSNSTDNTAIRFAGNQSNADLYLIGTNVGSNGTGANFQFYDLVAAATRLTLDSSGNLGLGVTPSAWTTFRALQVGAGASVFGHQTTVAEAYLSANSYFDAGNKYIGTGAATLYGQSAGNHYWYTAPSGTAGDAISFTQAATLTAAGNFVVGDTSSNFRLGSFVESGADRDMLIAAVKGVSNGLTVKFNNSTSTVRVNIQNLPTSIAGLTTGDLYNDSGTLKIA